MRILLGGLLGGLAMFMGGFIGHGVLGWGARAMKPIPDEPGFQAAIVAQKLEHGIYSIPYMNPSAADHDKEMARITEIYKKGPNGMLVVGRVGEDPMESKTLGMEFGSNVAFALLASWVVSRLAPSNGYVLRWLTVLAIALAAWFSVDASFHIWYRFHEKFVLDELQCVALEGAMAATVIAALVRPKSASTLEAS